MMMWKKKYANKWEISWKNNMTNKVLLVVSSCDEEDNDIWDVELVDYSARGYMSNKVLLKPTNKKLLSLQNHGCESIRKATVEV